MPNQVITCEIGVPLKVVKDPTINQWVADCPCLGIVTQAKTERKAAEAFEEAVELWFDSCLERNTLDQALTELGFVKGAHGRSRHQERLPFVKITITSEPVNAPVFDLQKKERETHFLAGSFPISATVASVMTPGIFHGQL